MNRLPIAIAQLNFTVGDVDAHVDKMLDAAHRARSELDCRVVIFPELSITGYPPEDLLFRRDFLERTKAGLARLAGTAKDISIIVGHPHQIGTRLYNAASVISEGQVTARYLKRELPNFGVFDEKRYFSAGDQPCVFEIEGINLGLTICEDVWHPQPVADCASAGADVVVNLNASPYDLHKAREREEQVVSQRAKASGVPIIYLNLVGGQVAV